MDGLHLSDQPGLIWMAKAHSIICLCWVIRLQGAGPRVWGELACFS